MHFIVLNGPPRSGKDTGTAIITRLYTDAMVYKMSRPLKRAIPAFFDIDDARWRQLQEQHKDIACNEFYQCTPREVQISLSEDWAKERFGVSIFGHLAVRFLSRSMTNLVVIDDAGFEQELYPLFSKYGRSSFLLIRLYREGCTYEGDSRSYLSPDDVTTHKYHNNHDLYIYEAFLKKVIGDKWPDRRVE